jgi:hypothetical protein
MASSNHEFKMTGVATKYINRRFAGDGAKPRSKVTLDPATGALIIPVDLRLKIENALRTEARRSQLRLYLRFPVLYLRKFGLEVRQLGLKLVSCLARNLPQFVGNRHG